MFLLQLLAILSTHGSQGALNIRPLGEPTRVEISARIPDEIVEGLPLGAIPAKVAEPFLTLRLVDDAGNLGPAVFGRYRRTGNSLVFIPRYRLDHGNIYRALLTLPNSKAITANYRVPPREVSNETMVVSVYPSGRVLPANNLKFYIYFSQPMREGRVIFERIKLLDENDCEVRDPWRRTELWTPDAKRLTLWIHPGSNQARC